MGGGVLTMRITLNIPDNLIHRVTPTNTMQRTELADVLKQHSKEGKKDACI
jgi:hypothetical protein